MTLRIAQPGARAARRRWSSASPTSTRSPTAAPRRSASSAPTSRSPTSTTRRGRMSSRWREALERRSSCRSTCSAPGQLEAVFDGDRASSGAGSTSWCTRSRSRRRRTCRAACSTARPRASRVAMDVSCHSFIRMARAGRAADDRGRHDVRHELPRRAEGGAELQRDGAGEGGAGGVRAATWRYELGPKGIRVHAISPGPLKTRAASGLKDFDLLLNEAAQPRAARRAGRHRRRRLRLRLPRDALRAAHDAARPSTSTAASTSWADRHQSRPFIGPCSSSLSGICRPSTATKGIERPNEASGAPGRSRTCDLWLRKPTLYPTELRARGRAGGFYRNVLAGLGAGGYNRRPPSSRPPPARSRPMKDAGFEHAHSSPIKTPQQLVVVIALAFVVPVIGIILLTQLHHERPENRSGDARAGGGGRAHPAGRPRRVRRRQGRGRRAQVGRGNL